MADSKISALTSYATPLNADLMPIVDTANTTTKQVSWTNIKATLKAYFDTLYVSIGGALGTPSSGTLTNATGLPVSGITASTSTALGVGSIELGHANDTSIARVSAGLVSIEGVNVMTVGATQTVTGQNKFNNLIDVNNAISASGNAATVPVTYRLSTVTNNSAATLTITMTTASAVDGQMTIVRVLDFSAAAQTITWVNTENSTVTAPTTSNGSTTLPVIAGFIYNSATSKWRCIASA